MSYIIHVQIGMTCRTGRGVDRPQVLPRSILWPVRRSSDPWADGAVLPRSSRSRRGIRIWPRAWRGIHGRRLDVSPEPSEGALDMTGSAAATIERHMRDETPHSNAGTYRRRDTRRVACVGGGFLRQSTRGRTGRRQPTALALLTCPPSLLCASAFRDRSRRKGRLT